MTLSLPEAVTGVTQGQITNFLIAKGRDPDEYEVFPFLPRPIIKNKVTGKWTALSKIKQWAEEQ